MKRALFVRPLGGFNDTLCRIALCLSFAERTRRTLILDTRDSGLMSDFDDFLRFHDDVLSTEVIPKVSQPLLTRLDGLSSYPHFINENTSLSEFVAQTIDERMVMAERYGVNSLKTDLGSDFQEELVYYEGYGGGYGSFSILPKLSLSDPVRSMLEDFARTLPPRYLGAHVRATDHRSDAKDFLKRLAYTRRSTPIFLASDNDDVLMIARTVYLPGRVLNQPHGTPLEADTPKHLKHQYVSTAQAKEATVQMFHDLFALAGASMLVYPLLDPQTTEDGLPKESGFSRLARHLAKNPDVFRGFFGIPRPTLPPRWRVARILTPWRYQFTHWRHHSYRYIPDFLRPRGPLKVFLDRVRGIHEL